jgi:hypothetical protein
VTGRADGDGSNQLATDSGVELRPRLLAGPCGITREHMTIRSVPLARRCQDGHRGELREEEAVHHVAESLRVLGIVVGVHNEAIEGAIYSRACILVYP